MCYFHHYYSGCTLMDMPQLLESRGCIKSLLRFIILGCIRISLSGNNIFQTGIKYQTLIYYCLFLRSELNRSIHQRSPFLLFHLKSFSQFFMLFKKLLHPIGKVIQVVLLQRNYISPTKPNVSWTLILYVLPDVLIPVF